MSPVEEIKSRIDPVQFIGEYVKLQRAGINWRALCPFHQEKTPSFFVSPVRGTWRCFGCSKGGDIFTFVMEKEGLSFRDALEMLARRAGIELRPERPEIRKEREELFSILDAAANFFENQLRDEESKKARQYLAERGLTAETIKEFRIGYAPNVWDALLKYLGALGHQLETIEKAGLVIKREEIRDQRLEGRNHYDRFRGRIMFPITDLVGRVVGFSGRILPEFESETSGGKYVNSPETPLFQKSRVLYGLDKAKSEIQRQGAAVLVEGQMDLLMTYQEGIKNVVATSGTALTPMHLAILKRYASKLIFAFDQDSAGAAATERAITLASRMGFDARVAVFEEKDPAELARHDPEKLRSNVANSLPSMSYYIDRAFAAFPSQELEGKTLLVRWILPKIKTLPNLVERSHWLELLSSRLRIPTQALEGELIKVTLENLAETAPLVSQDTREISSEDKEKLIPLPKTRVEILAERLIAIWLAKTQEVSPVRKGGALDPTAQPPQRTELSNGVNQGVGERSFKLPGLWEEVYEFVLTIKDAEALRPEDIPLHLAPYLEGAMLRKEWEEAIGEADYSEEEFLKTINEIRREMYRERIKDLTFAIREAEQKGNSEELKNLLEELKQISSEFYT